MDEQLTPHQPTDQHQPPRVTPEGLTAFAPTDAADQPAEVVVPPEAFGTAPAPTDIQTGDDAPDYDYAGMLADQQITDMQPDELRSIYAPAQHAVSTYQAEALLDVVEASGVLSPSQGLRVMGKVGKDLQVWQRAQASYMAALPRGARVNIATLQGAALDQARSQFLRDYLDSATAERFEQNKALQGPAARLSLDRMVQARHFYVSALPALENSVRAHRAQQEAGREAAELKQARTTVGAMSDLTFDATYAAVFSRWNTANEEGDSLQAEIAKTEMTRLAQARWKKG